MIWFFCMQIPPLAYCAAYFMHCVRKRRTKQAVMIAALTVLNLLALATLLYEFFAVP